MSIKIDHSQYEEDGQQLTIFFVKDIVQQTSFIGLMSGDKEIRISLGSIHPAACSCKISIKRAKLMRAIINDFLCEKSSEDIDILKSLDPSLEEILEKGLNKISSAIEDLDLSSTDYTTIVKKSFISFT